MDNFIYDLALQARDNSNSGLNTSVENIEELISKYLQCDCYFDDWIVSDRLSTYFITKNYCTDTFVGISAVFLDNELVAITHQVSRKSDLNYYFVNQEMSKKFLNFLRVLRDEYLSEKSLLKNLPNLNLETFKELQEGFFQVHYESEIIPSSHTRVYLKENNSYLPCDSYKLSSNTFINRTLEVVFKGNTIIKDLKDIYFKCSSFT